METLRHWRKKMNKAPGKGKTFHTHVLTELILWKWLYAESSLHIQSNLYQNPNDILHRADKNIPKIYKDAKGLWIIQWTLRKKRNAEVTTIPDLKLCYRAIVNDTGTKADR